MSKFNKENSMSTTNKCGYAAYKMEDKLRLVTMVLTTMFNEQKYYGDNSTELVKLAETIAQIDAHFISNLAVYARREMNLRSVSHVLTSIIAKHGRAFTGRTVSGVVLRADDITEILACYLNMYGKPIPNALKKALAHSMGNFDEYQFAKYSGNNKSIKFKDVLRLTHPVPNTAKLDELFGKIINDTLEIPYTWEVELSTRGNTKEVWEELIDSGKVGYMALLRNLRNIINVHPDNIDKVYSILSDPEKVRRSRQLPFRFYSAYRVVKNMGCSNKVIDVLEDAVSASCDNIEKIHGKTLIAIDVSGSMSSTISGNSDVRCCDIASIIAAIANKICDESIIYTFDTRLFQKTCSSRSGILQSADSFITYGGGTDISLPFRQILNNNINVDRVILLSDNEINSGRYGGYKHICQSIVNQYRERVNPNLWVHAIDMQGYGTQQFIGNKTNIIAGWNEKVLQFINMSERGFDTMLSAIESYDQ